MTPTEKADDLCKRLRFIGPRNGETDLQANLRRRAEREEAIALIKAQAADIAQLRSYLGRSQEEAGELLTRATKAEARLAAKDAEIAHLQVELAAARPLYSRRQIEARLAAYEEALTPSDYTKAEYIGDFKFNYTVWEPHGEFEITHTPTVPWTTIKEIMKAISDCAARAFLNKEPSDVQS